MTVASEIQRAQTLLVEAAGILATLTHQGEVFNVCRVIHQITGNAPFRAVKLANAAARDPQLYQIMSRAGCVNPRNATSVSCWLNRLQKVIPSGFVLERTASNPITWQLHG